MCQNPGALPAPENANLSYGETVALANKIATQNILDGKHSALGDFYSNLISQNQ
jgi:hypothetical protein